MVITPYSCLTAIVCFVAAILLADYLSWKIGFFYHYSAGVLIFFFCLPIARMLFPIELPFTKVFRDSYVLPQILQYLNHPLLVFGGVSITFLRIFLIIWIVGILYHWARLLRDHRHDMSLISTFERIQSAAAEEYLRELAANSRPRQAYELIVTPDISTPLTMGYIKPIILIPAVEEDVDTIHHFIAHEWRHVLNRDQLIKLFVRMMCGVFWWIRPIRKLDKNLDHTLELRVDAQLLEGKGDDDRLCYLEALFIASKCANQSKNQQIQSAHASRMLGNATVENAIAQRFSIIANAKENSKKSVAIFISVMLIVFILSYSIVWQPFYGYPEMEEIGYNHSVPTEESYLVDNGDGTYSFYIGEEFFWDITENERRHPPHNLLPIITNET